MFKEDEKWKILGGHLQDKKSHATGTYRGYHICIQPVNTQYVVRINTQSEADPNNAALLQFLTQQGTVNKK